MVGEILGGLFEGFIKLVLGLLVIVLCLSGAVTYFLIDTTDDNIHKVNKKVIPTVEINSKTINGVTTSDTTYIYDFNEKR